MEKSEFVYLSKIGLPTRKVTRVYYETNKAQIDKDRYAVYEEDPTPQKAQATQQGRKAADKDAPREQPTATEPAANQVEAPKAEEATQKPNETTTIKEPVKADTQGQQKDQGKGPTK